MKKTLALLAFLLTFITSNQCVIIGVDVWMKVINGQKHYIYGLGDIHLFQKTKQSDDIAEYAKKFEPNNVLLLCEIDENDNKEFHVQRNADVEITALYDAFNSNQLPVIGVEKRILRSGDIKNNIKDDAIYYKDVCDKISSYNDSLYLSTLYKKFVNSTEAKLQILKEKTDASLISLIIFYLQTISNLALNEIEALHQIYINQYKKHIFLYFGAYHINFLNHHLPNLGYRKIYSYGYRMREINDNVILSHSEDKLANSEIKIEDLKKHLNMKHVFGDLNDRFNIFGSSNKITSKL